MRTKKTTYPYIPLGKALAPEKTDEDRFEKCKQCCLRDSLCRLVCCSDERKDRKEVVFKYVDLPKKDAN